MMTAQHVDFEIKIRFENRSRHVGVRGQMEHNALSPDGGANLLADPHVALDKSDPVPGLRKVFYFPRGEIVERGDARVFAHEGIDQVRPEKSSATGDEHRDS